MCLGWFAGFSRPKRSGDPGATFFIAALTFQEAAVRGHASLKEVLRLWGRCRGEQHGNRCLSRHLPGKANFPRTKASFWREIRSSAFASQYRLCSTSLFAPPSRRKQLQVDGGLRRDIEQCLTASFVPRSARCRVHCRLLRALLLRAYCQPALVACSRCAAVGRASRRLAVGNARFLPHFRQNALLVASISLYKLAS